MLTRATIAADESGEAAATIASARSHGGAPRPRSQTAKSSAADRGRIVHYPTAGTVKDGSVGLVAPVDQVVPENQAAPPGEVAGQPIRDAG